MNATSDENIGLLGGHIEREDRGHMGTTECVGLLIGDQRRISGRSLGSLICMTFGNRRALKQDLRASTQRDIVRQRFSIVAQILQSP